MAISMNCPACLAFFELPDDLAGQQVRCQQCRQVFEVKAPPAPVVAPVPAAEAPPPPKRTPPPPEPTASLGWLIATLLLFVLGLFGIGAFSVAWIATHLGAPLQSTRPIHLAEQDPDGVRFKDKRVAKDRFAKDDRALRDKGFFLDQKKPAEAVRPVEIFPAFDGSALVNARANFPAGWIDHGKWGNDGPYSLHRIRLQQGKIYNFHVAGFNITPRLRIFDGEASVADKMGVFPARRLMISYEPKRTADYLIHITTQERFAGNFTMNIAPYNRPVPVAAILNHPYQHRLRVEYPFNIGAKNHGPTRDYEVTLEADREYLFNLDAHGFNWKPVMQIQENGRTLEYVGDFNQRIQISYRPPAAGKYKLAVTSKDFALGDYTLRMVQKLPTLQTILAGLDENGDYTDRREFGGSDPRLAGNRSTKAYVISLEQGRKYRIEMSLPNASSSVMVFDPDQKRVAENQGLGSAVVTYTAPRSGTYAVHAGAVLPKNQQPYQLRVTRLP
ncbi:MAG: hypothetical protein HYX68_14705 [Planctomycetes bacterium]|nr:hypothetical protein [Planctomycetota bacterium]